MFLQLQLVLRLSPLVISLITGLQIDKEESSRSYLNFMLQLTKLDSLLLKE
jgi:hypothetical protein